jgi:uncharacterized coiled-coil protein SlyX
MVDVEQRIETLESRFRGDHDLLIKISGKVEAHDVRITSHKSEFSNMFIEMRSSHKEILDKLEDMSRSQIVLKASLEALSKEYIEHKDRMSKDHQEHKEKTNEEIEGLKNLKNKIIGASIFFPMIWGGILFIISKFVKF